MRSTWRMVTLVLAAGVSCGRGDNEASKLSEDLQKDLAAASSASMALASAAQGYQPMRFVSEIEQVKRAEPVARRPEPKPVVHDHSAAEAQQERAPDPAPMPVVETPKAPEAEQPAETSDAPRVPSVAPRPAPMPVDYPADVGSGGTAGPGTREGPDLGTIIGVIIRGGVLDPGHCPPRRGRPPRFPR